jgi:hypothetical protein
MPIRGSLALADVTAGTDVLAVAGASVRVQGGIRSPSRSTSRTGTSAYRTCCAICRGRPKREGPLRAADPAPAETDDKTELTVRANEIILRIISVP